jgi:hypothetical protein
MADWDHRMFVVAFLMFRHIQFVTWQELVALKIHHHLNLD